MIIIKPKKLNLKDSIRINYNINIKQNNNINI